MNSYEIFMSAMRFLVKSYFLGMVGLIVWAFLPATGGKSLQNDKNAEVFTCLASWRLENKIFAKCRISTRDLHIRVPRQKLKFSSQTPRPRKS